MVGDCLVNRFRFKLYCIYLHDTKLPPEINSIYAYINPNSRIVRRHYLWEVLTVTIAIGGAITLFDYLWSINQ
jgi:hypothetical protein